MKSILGIVTVIAALGLGACESPPTQDAAIWNKPPRYGHGGTQDEKPPSGVLEADEKKNRFGFGGEDGAATQAGDARGNSATTGNMQPNANGNLGATPGASDAPTDTASAEKKDDKKSDTSKKDSGGSKSNPPSNLKSYPFGKPVPGKGGFVTLPSPHDGLGEIDVRGIAPGTPVEIPDPTKPGKKIYFRVP